MKKRSPGWTWAIAVLSSPWNFKGMKSPAFSREGLCKYLQTGDFTDNQKESWLIEVRRKYEAWCERNGVEVCVFPPSLEKQIKKLRSR